MKADNIWSSRYAHWDDVTEIRRRATVTGSALTGLGHDSVELACRRLVVALKAMFIPTERTIQIIQSELCKAHAHATMYYSSPHQVLARAYSDCIEIDDYRPTCLIGPAGVGKSHVCLAIDRVIGPSPLVPLGPGHGEVQTVGFTRISIGEQKSISQILLPLAGAEMMGRRFRISEAKIAAYCALHQARVGACLVGIDEAQKLAQSDNASARANGVLLAMLGVKVPWFCVMNYGLAWKLLDRPPEATQRYLGRPEVLLPDAAASPAWLELLTAYQRVAAEILDFDLKARRIELWNFSAGLKRLLLQIIELTYRKCRARGVFQIRWEDVEAAYKSMDYLAARSDVERMISHAIQGGDLKRDLSCPFVDEVSLHLLDAYKSQLREARRKIVALAALDAAMNVPERAALKTIEALQKPQANEPTGTVVKLRGRTKRSVASLQEAANRFNSDR